MVATAPGLMPPGYLSLDGALERVDRGLLSDIGTDEDRRAFDKFVSASKWQSDSNGVVLAPAVVHDEFARRTRRRVAFERICKLCAYGQVCSALLLDDFSIRLGIPSIFWLDERLSVTMQETGRALVTKPRDRYAVDGPSGWVMVEMAGLERVLGRAPADLSGQPGLAASETDRITEGSDMATDTACFPKPTNDLMRRMGQGVSQLERALASDRELYGKYTKLLRVIGLNPTVLETLEPPAQPTKGAQPRASIRPDRPTESVAVPTIDHRPKPTNQAVRSWFRERVKSWPDSEKAPGEAADWKAITQHFAPGLSRNDDFRLARKQETPPGWRKQGRRPRWGVEKNSAG